MKIYEMLFIKPFDDGFKKFYKTNTLEARINFMSALRSENDKELLSFYHFCREDLGVEVLDVYKEIHKENHNYLNQLEESFLMNGYAEVDDFIFIKVIEYIWEEN